MVIGSFPQKGATLGMNEKIRPGRSVGLSQVVDSPELEGELFPVEPGGFDFELFSFPFYPKGYIQKKKIRGHLGYRVSP